MPKHTYSALFLGAFALSAALTACSGKPSVSPIGVVESLYSFDLSSPMVGLPTEAQSAHIARFLDPELNAMIERARMIRDSATRAAPSEKPPWTDGDLFTSHFEGPNSFYVKATAEGRGTTALLVRFEHVEDSTRVNWVDTVYVVARRGEWLISDVAFGGTWPFAAKGTLRQKLTP